MPSVNGAGGGVAVCVQCHVNFKERPNLSYFDEDCEIVFVEIETGHQLQNHNHTRPRSVAAGNRHSHATLGIMGNHRKVVLYHNNVDFTATRGQRVKATTV